MAKDSLTGSLYLKRAHPERYLTSEEEINLFRRISSGDRKAVEELYHISFGFIFRTAKKYCRRGLPFEDLIEEGNMGFITAVRKFNISKGVRFLSYAEWWIKQEISRAIRKTSKMIRLPDGQYSRLGRIRKELGKTGDKCTPEIISEISMFEKIPDEEVYYLLWIGKDVESMSNRMKYDSEEKSREKTIGGLVADKKEDHIRNVGIKNLGEALEYSLSFLSEIEVKILKDRFGLDGSEGKHSQEELSIKYNCSRPTIGNIEKRALKKLKQNPEINKILSGFLPVKI